MICGSAMAGNEAYVKLRKPGAIVRVLLVEEQVLRCISSHTKT